LKNALAVLEYPPELQQERLLIGEQVMLPDGSDT